MSYWVRCNACFLAPSADRKLALTTCGHVICCVCYHKVKQDKCLICNAECQVSPLSDKSSSEVKALFSDINSVATKHLTEISKVIMFQARHQKRLLTHYQQRNETLEEMLVKMKQEIQHMTKKMNEQGTYILKLQQPLQHKSVTCSAVTQMNHISHKPYRHKPVVHIPYSSPMSRHTSTTNVAKIMEVDERSLFRNPNSILRLSLLSPPKDGHMGSIAHRLSHQNTLSNHSACSATVSRCPGATVTPDFSYSLCSGWKTPIFRPPPSYRHPPP